MTKQILLSLLNCSWQWMLLSGLIWFFVTPLFHKSRRSNTTVHLLWLLSLLSLPILFGLNQFVPALSIGGDPVPALTQANPIDVSGLAALTTDLPEISTTESDIQSKNQLLAGGESFFNWIKTDLLLYLWAIGALAMLVRFMFGLYRIHQLRRSAVAADDSYQAICRRLARQLDIKRPVTVCFSDRVASPISFGWLSPSILIPRKLSLEQFALVAAHELAHVQRLDWLTNLFSHLVGVIFFFHPIYHFLNRELVRVRERICDDWVIQLTGSRKNYAQCLLDLVRHRDRAIPLALSLNQPSQLESRIDAILKDDRRLDVQLKPRLQLIVATLLLTCLPVLAMAQLVPLKTFQVSLFAQTPEKSEKAVDKIQEKQGMQKAKTEKMGKKEYKDDAYIKVEDPALSERSEENRIFSGPQPGEKLPPLNITGVKGETDGKTFDITTKADKKPLVLFLQDTNAVGVKGLVNVSKLLLKVDAFQKRHSKATGDEKSNQGLQIGVVFLADSLDTLPDWAHDMLNEEMPNEILTGISPDGREGPGSYGLNRNVAQTVIVAKDGKVLHNFAFTQPMLYTDPHFLGAIAQAIEVEPTTLEKWLNEATAKRSDEKYDWVELWNITDGELKLKPIIITEINDTAGDASDWVVLPKLSDSELNMQEWMLGVDAEERVILFKKDVKLPANGFLLLDAESLKKSGITLKEVEKLLKKEQGQRSKEKMDGKSSDREALIEQLKRLQRITETLFATVVQEMEKGKLNPEALVEQLDVLDKRLQRITETLSTIAEGHIEKDSLDLKELVEQVKAFNERLQRITESVSTANRENRNRYRRENVEVKNPAEFKKVQGAKLFSGPQPGEKLPPLMAKGINDETKGKTFDVIAEADGQPLVLFLQDESGLGLRGLLGISRLLAQIAEKSEQKMLTSAVFLGDAPDTLENQVSRLVPHIPSSVLLGISQEGREGPGSYGLNRNVAQTVIIAKDGKVLHNFAFTQPMLRPDPYVLGAVGAAIGVKPATLEKWLNEKPAEGERMEGSREQMRRGEDSDEVAVLRKRIREDNKRIKEIRKRHKEAVRKLEAALKEHEEAVRDREQRGK